MNTLVVLLSVLAAATASHYGSVIVGHGTHGSVLQAPSAHAAVVGPDGSHISGSVHGGAVVAPGHHAGVISAAVTPGHIAYTAPVVHAPAFGYAHGYAHGGLVAGVLPYAGHFGHYAGDGHEGQYVPSGLENLYDDGSYRAEHHYSHDDHHYY